MFITLKFIKVKKFCEHKKKIKVLLLLERRLGEATKHSSNKSISRTVIHHNSNRSTYKKAGVSFFEFFVSHSGFNAVLFKRIFMKGRSVEASKAGCVSTSSK
jgi:hypothetical protein